MNFRIAALVLIAAVLCMGSQCGFGTPAVSSIATPVDEASAQFTGQGDGSSKQQIGYLQVINDYQIDQYVFVNDTEFIGTVPPGETQIWQLAAGDYKVTCSDSGNPNDNPFSENFTITHGDHHTFTVFTQTN